jgi:hypothetical protein
MAIPMSLTSMALLCLAAPLAAEGYDYGNAGFGAWTIPVPLDLQAQQDLQPGQGMLVIGVRPGGTASTLGIQPGDVLTSLNNAQISSRHDIREVVLSAQPGDAAQASVVTPDGTSESFSGTFQARPQRPAWMGAFGAGAGPGPGPGAAAGLPAVDAAMAALWDPQNLIAQQREELLAEQDALGTIQGLITRLRSDLAAAGAATGAWQLHYALTPPPPTRLEPGAAVALSATGSAGGESVPAAASSAWSCSISCCTPAARLPASP